MAQNQVTKLSQFQTKIPVIKALCTEGLKEDHIAKMAKRLNMVGTDITKVPVNTLEDPEKHIDYLEEISDFADKQHKNEMALKAMLDAWEPLEFTPKDWKGSAILDGEAVEQLQATLDDHIIKTQTMRGSPYIEPFKDKLFGWEDTLMAT